MQFTIDRIDIKYYRAIYLKKFINNSIWEWVLDI